MELGIGIYGTGTSGGGGAGVEKYGGLNPGTGGGKRKTGGGGSEYMGTRGGGLGGANHGGRGKTGLRGGGERSNGGGKMTAGGGADDAKLEERELLSSIPDYLLLNLPKSLEMNLRVGGSQPSDQVLLLMGVTEGGLNKDDAIPISSPLVLRHLQNIPPTQTL
nr:hypothetical protein Iba_chr06fCG8410 [Ipomoea batatas]